MIGVGLLLIATGTALTTIMSVSAKSESFVKRCENEGESMIIVEGALDRYKKYLKATNGLAAFLVNFAELSEKSKLIEKILDKKGSRSIVLKLNSDDLKEADKVKRNKKKLKKVIKKIKADFREKSGEADKKLRSVMLPPKTSKKIIKAFKKQHVIVLKSAYESKSRSETEKLVEKSKKSGSSISKKGGIILFKASEKNSRSLLKKLRKSLMKREKLVKAKACFKKTKRSKNDKEEGEEGKKLNIIEVENEEYDLEGEEDLIESKTVNGDLYNENGITLNINEEVSEEVLTTETSSNVVASDLGPTSEEESNTITASINIDENVEAAPVQVQQSINHPATHQGHFNPVILEDDDISTTSSSSNQVEEEEINMGTIYSKNSNEESGENVIDISEINPAINPQEGSVMGASLFGKSKSSSDDSDSSSDSSSVAAPVLGQSVKVISSTHHKAKLYGSSDEESVSGRGFTTLGKGIEDLVEGEDPKAVLVPTIQDLDYFTQIKEVFNRKTLMITEKEMKKLNKLAEDCKGSSYKKDSKKSAKEKKSKGKKKLKSTIKRIIEGYKDNSGRSLGTIVIAGDEEMAGSIHDLFKKEKITVIRGEGSKASSPDETLVAAKPIVVSITTRASSVISSDSDDEHSESAHSIEAIGLEFDSVNDIIHPKSRGDKHDTRTYSYDSFVSFMETKIEIAQKTFIPTYEDLTFLRRMLDTFKKDTLRLTSSQIQVYTSSTYAKTLQKSVEKIRSSFKDGTDYDLKFLIVPRDTASDFIESFTSSGVNVKYDKKLPNPLTPADSTRARKGSKKDKPSKPQNGAVVIDEEHGGCRCVIA